MEEKKKKISAAVLGLNQNGNNILKALNQLPQYHLIGVADMDQEKTQKQAMTYNCPPYNDFRQLVIQKNLDVLFAAAPDYQCEEFIRLAIKNKCHIIKSLPPGINFEQISEIIRLAKKNNVRFAAINNIAVNPAVKLLNQYLSDKNLADFYLIDAFRALPMPPERYEDRWLTDPELAGGGVLLWNCYELIDQIVNLFKMPERVYALTSNMAPDKQQRLSITEDTAVLSMRFSDTLTATLLASRTFGPKQFRLRIYGKKNNVVIDQNSFAVINRTGEIIEKKEFTPQPENQLNQILKTFAEALTEQKKLNTINENQILKNMALIESAYLSSRTQMPEEPNRIINLPSAQTNIWSSEESQDVV
jgi:predicted dehydrogenase